MFDYLIAPLIIIGLMAFWTVIQFAWKRFFPEAATDEDVLATRPKCGACHISEQYLDDTKCEKDFLGQNSSENFSKIVTSALK